MTHTPGPWNYAGPSDIGRDTYSIYGNGPLAHTAGPSDYGDAAEANARLIAAAPELLMVLSYALADLDDVMPEFEPSGDRTHSGWQTIEDIKVALAKATGQCIRIENLVADCQCKCDCHDGQSVASDYDPDCSSCCIEAELEAAREGVTA